VIGDTITDNNLAKDDKYTVAPLIGWVWGFDITYRDVGVIGVDELGDFTVKKRDFSFVTTPSATWTQALGAKYGAGEKQDFWNIATGACADCKPVPGASTRALVSSGLRDGGRRRSQAAARLARSSTVIAEPGPAARRGVPRPRPERISPMARV